MKLPLMEMQAGTSLEAHPARRPGAAVRWHLLAGTLQSRRMLEWPLPLVVQLPQHLPVEAALVGP